MLTVVRTIAVLMIVIGGIWFLQGVNVLPGSFMTGQIRWAFYGAGSVACGLLIFFLSRRR